MATEPAQSKKALKSETHSPNTQHTPLSQDTKNDEIEENENISDLVDNIYVFMEKRCPDKKISESIAIILNKHGITLEAMTDWDDEELNAYVDTWDLGILERITFKEGTKKMRERMFNFISTYKFYFMDWIIVFLFVLCSLLFVAALLDRS